jgi:hypothetical protein
VAKKGRVFLCHNSREKEQIKPLALDLLSLGGIRTWLDTWEIPGGADWERHIRREFAASWSCLVFLGQSGFGPFQREEIAWAKERQAIDPDYRLIPVLLPGLEGESIKELDCLLPGVHWIDLRNGCDSAENLTPVFNAIRGEGPGPPVQALTAAVAAERWDQTGRSDRSLLIRGRALREAQQLAKDTEAFDELSLLYLAASAEAQQRRVRLGMLILASAVVLLAGSSWYANEKRLDAVAAADGERQAKVGQEAARKQAEKDRDSALKQEAIAKEQRNLAQERLLLAQSQATAADARRETTQELNMALVAGAEAFRIKQSIEAETALLEGLSRAEKIKRFFLCAPGEKATGVTFSNGSEASLAFFGARQN